MFMSEKMSDNRGEEKYQLNNIRETLVDGYSWGDMTFLWLIPWQENWYFNLEDGWMEQVFGGATLQLRQKVNNANNTPPLSHLKFDFLKHSRLIHFYYLPKSE